jgi:peptidoglycan/xylan/chitin deacetylase (PgdA/CDA1 family)
MPPTGRLTSGKSDRFQATMARRVVPGGVFLIFAALILTAQPGAAAEKRAAMTDRKAQAASAAVMTYHRFGESGLPATNIRIAQFEAHLKELTTGEYAVRPLPEIIADLKSGKTLRDRTVAITIDDAFRSVYREAWPRLRRAGLPFTLFVATDAVDGGGRGFMTWDQVREMAKAGVTIGAHSASHAHLAALPPVAVTRELEKSNHRFQQELGFRPRLFAYPYGEANLMVMDAARAAGYAAAFGQHSGALHGQADFFYLPRFALNEHYGSLKRFRLAANVLPLYAAKITPRDPTLGPNPPAFGFTVGPGIRGLRGMTCYSSAHGKLKVERPGPRRIEIRPPTPFAAGRARINCTLPAGGSGRWRWFGYQFFVPGK